MSEKKDMDFIDRLLEHYDPQSENERESKEIEFDENIDIYNKVGLAYGQLTDVAYIINNDISIILTATIDVNTNKIYNDDNYEYELIGFPFLAQLSRGIFKKISEN